MERYQAVHLSMSVRFHAGIRAKPTGRIYVKFDIGSFIKSVEIYQVFFKKRRNTGHFTCIIKHVLLLPATLNYHNEHFSNDMVSER